MATKLTALGVFIALALVLVVSAVSPAAPPASGEEGEEAGATARDRDNPDAKASLKNVDGNVVGVVRFEARRGGRVEVEAELKNVAPVDQFHGFHVHTTGQCDPTTEVPFSSAGGHFNPEGAIHGEHAGDFPVLFVKSGGRAEAKFETDRFRLSQLFDEDGSAVIVHAGKDNYANIPAATPTGGERYHSHAEDVFGPDSATKATGDAGDRFACGVVSRS
jgi:Cu-Zn family superoxide dismutase